MPLGKPLRACRALALRTVPITAGSGRRPLALLWQNVFSPLFFKDLLSAIWALLGRRPKEEI
ncbi:hypothetical protein, partial [Bradyrhizobium sp. 76]|uniref:hypothetical protein n=1 Tax=Bradyrhizobium sp. 76 TaxID=2782680 RepID=UPI001FF939D6